MNYGLTTMTITMAIMTILLTAKIMTEKKWLHNIRRERTWNWGIVLRSETHRPWDGMFSRKLCVCGVHSFEAVCSILAFPLGATGKQTSTLIMVSPLFSKKDGGNWQRWFSPILTPIWDC